jgi:hypothetical protein
MGLDVSLTAHIAMIRRVGATRKSSLNFETLKILPKPGPGAAGNHAG